MPNLYKYFLHRHNERHALQGKMVPLRYEFFYSSANAHVSFLCERSNNLLLIVAQCQKTRCYDNKFHTCM